MKKSHIILSILSIALLVALPMETIQSHAIEIHSNTQYKKFIEAFKCLKKKGWKHCTPKQKARIVATGLALIAIVGTAISVYKWKRHVRKRLKNDQPIDWTTPDEKAKVARKKEELDKRAGEIQAKREALNAQSVENRQEIRQESEKRAKREKVEKQEATRQLAEFKKKSEALKEKHNEEDRALSEKNPISRIIVADTQSLDRERVAIEVEVYRTMIQSLSDKHWEERAELKRRFNQ